MSYHYQKPPAPPQQRQQQLPVQVRVPFLRQAVGLGDVVKRATGAVGVKPCGGCQARAAWLNRHVQLVPRGGR